MNRIWRYSLTADNGMAPCADRGKLSLSCCKPMIRRNACVGDWVIGFVPRRINDGQVHIAWAGHVAKSVLLGDYQKQYPERQDAIYKIVESPWTEETHFIRLRNDYHDKEKNKATDLAGKNALIFDPFWYWGGRGIGVPCEIAKLAHYYVGQSTQNSTSGTISCLEKWLRSVAAPGIHGEPRDKRRTTPQCSRSCSENLSSLTGSRTAWP
jgi:hypothetical protein